MPIGDSAGGGSAGKKVHGGLSWIAGPSHYLLLHVCLCGAVHCYLPEVCRGCGVDAAALVTIGNANRK